MKSPESFRNAHSGSAGKEKRNLEPSVTHRRHMKNNKYATQSTRLFLGCFKTRPELSLGSILCFWMLSWLLTNPAAGTETRAVLILVPSEQSLPYLKNSHKGVVNLKQASPCLKRRR